MQVETLWLRRSRRLQLEVLERCLIAHQCVSCPESVCLQGDRPQKRRVAEARNCACKETCDDGSRDSRRLRRLRDVQSRVSGCTGRAVGSSGTPFLHISARSTLQLQMSTFAGLDISGSVSGEVSWINSPRPGNGWSRHHCRRSCIVQGKLVRAGCRSCSTTGTCRTS